MRMKAFKYRIYPTKEQETLLNDTLFRCSRLYNDLLAERRDVWREHQVSIDYRYQANLLPSRKKKDPSLRKVHSQVLQNVIKRLDLAFEGFFRRVKAGEKPGYPRFRPYRRYDSFTYPQAAGFGVLEDGKHLCLSKIGEVRIKLHRQIEGDPKTCTIRRRAGRWYAVITCEVEDKIPLPVTGKVAGVDMGITNFAITSEEEFFPSARFLRNTLSTIARLQRAVARSKKGSKRRVKKIQALARAHQRLANRRSDMHFKTALALVRQYDLIGVEELEIRNLVKNHHLALSIQDAAWGNFLAFSEAKRQKLAGELSK